MSDEIYLENDDVVSVSQALLSPLGTTTSTVGEIRKSLLTTCLAGNLQHWITNGMSCKVLLADGGGWQDGKILLRLEFIPNNPKMAERKAFIAISEPVSPLDDLRSQLNPE
ncbi:MAG: KGK domain-containing protein [Nostoc sp.]